MESPCESVREGRLSAGKDFLKLTDSSCYDFERGSGRTEQSLRTLEKSPAGVKRPSALLVNIPGVQPRHWKACTLGVRTKS